MSETTIRERMYQFIDEIGCNTHSFERNCGLKQGIIQKMNNLRTDSLAKILATYPELDVYWLLGVERNARGQQVIMPFNEEKNSCSQKNYEEAEKWYKEQLMQKDRQINFLMQMLEKNGQQINL